MRLAAQVRALRGGAEVFVSFSYDAEAGVIVVDVPTANRSAQATFTLDAEDLREALGAILPEHPRATS